MPKDFVLIKNAIDRLKELGVPQKITDDLSAWLGREKKKEELLKTTSLNQRTGIRRIQKF